MRVTLTSLKRIRESVTSPFHAAGVCDRSVLVARKSLLSAAIWLLICFIAMFCSSVL